MSLVIEFGKIYTQFKLYAKMTMIIGLTLLVLQLVLFCGLCSMSISSQSVMIVLKFYAAKLAVLFHQDPEITLRLSGMEMTASASQIADMDAIKRFIGREIYAVAGYFILSFGVYALLPLISAYLKRRAAKAEEPEHRRGTELVTPEELEAAVKKEMKEKGETLTLPIGGVRMPRYAEQRHTCVVGKPGTMKTVDMRARITEIRRRGERAIIHDPKGDYILKFYDPKAGDIILNPLDIRSPGWSLFNELRTPMDIASLAASLIPPASGNDLFWNNAGRDVLRGVLAALEVKGQRTNADIYRLCSSELTVIAGELKGIRGAESALAYLDDQKLGSNVRAVMMQFVGGLEYARDGAFCMTDWVRDDAGRGFVFISNLADLHEVLKPLNSLAMDFAARRLLSMKESNSRRIHFLIDELGQLQELPTLRQLLNLGRGFGAAVDIRFQGVGQLRKIYGKDHFEDLINACSNVLVLGVNDPGTADYFSQLIQSQEVQIGSQSTSLRLAEGGDGVTVNQQIKEQRAVMQAEITGLPDGACFVKIVNQKWTKSQIKYQDYPDRNEAFLMDDKYSFEQLRKVAAESAGSSATILGALISGTPGAAVPVPGTTEEELAEARAAGPCLFTGLSQDGGPNIASQIEDLDNYDHPGNHLPDHGPHL